MDPITLGFCFLLSYALVNRSTRKAIADGVKAAGRKAVDFAGGALEGGGDARRGRPTRHDTTGGGGGGGGTTTAVDDTAPARHRRPRGGTHSFTDRSHTPRGRAPGDYPDGGGTTTVLDPPPDIDTTHPLHDDTTRQLSRSRRRGYRTGYRTVVRTRRVAQWGRGVRSGGRDARRVPAEPMTAVDPVPGTGHDTTRDTTPSGDTTPAPVTPPEGDTTGAPAPGNDLTREPPADGRNDPDTPTTSTPGEPAEGDTSTASGTEHPMASTMPAEITDHGTLEKVLDEKFHRLGEGEDNVTQELEDLARLPETVEQGNFGPKTMQALQNQAEVANAILAQLRSLMEQLTQARQQVIDAKGE